MADVATTETGSEHDANDAGSVRSTWFRRWRRRLPAGVVILAALYFGSCLHGGFARPVAGLWPPKPDEPTHRLVVSVDQWHSVIGVWPEVRASQKAGDPADYSELEEWSYSERAYYMDGDQGPRGVMRAMLVPSDAVVRATRAGKPWSLRAGAPPARLWSFRISEESRRRLMQHIKADRSSDRVVSTVRGSKWYEARRSYHGLHHCHHWTADVLRSAGLPMWTSHAQFKWSLERQLDRAAEY